MARIICRVGVFPVVAAAISLSGCGGGGGLAFVSSPPAVTPTPTPTPTPIPAQPALNTAALVEPVQTLVPASPSAVSTSTKFDITTAGTFPVLMTAVQGSGGDQTTTSAGGALVLGTDQFGITINNAQLGAMTAGNGTNLSNGLQLGLQWNNDLDYTRYGYWDIHSPGYAAVYNGGAWLGGFITPPASIPTTGTAQYAGAVTGQYWTSPGYYEIARGGVQLTANFGSGSITGSMTNMRVTSSDATIWGPLNDIGFSATIDHTANMFSGTTNVLNVPTSNAAFSANAAGFINGRFFGPSAQEVGAVFTLSDNVHRLIGSFGAH